MARTPAQRGTFGRWLTASREARFRTQRDALAAMRRLAGLHISNAEYSQWESGSRVPRADNPKVERLYEFFGSRPQEETGPTLSGEAGLAQAISDQTKVLSALLEWLKGQDEALAAVQAGVALNATRLEALEKTVRRQDPRAGGAAGEPAPHQTSAE